MFWRPREISNAQAIVGSLVGLILIGLLIVGLFTGCSRDVFAKIECSGDEKMDESHCTQQSIEHEHCWHFSAVQHAAVNHEDKYCCLCGKNYCGIASQEWRKSHGEYLQ